MSDMPSSLNTLKVSGIGGIIKNSRNSIFEQCSNIIIDIYLTKICTKEIQYER